MADQSPRIDFSNIRFVFLDRDGVINRKLPEGEYVTDWSRFELLPGVADAIAALNHSGRTVIVVTNQRGISLGLYSEADVNSIHRRLQETLGISGARIDAFYFCPHDKDQCDCRKPGTGMFLEAFREFPAATPANSIVIGDSLSDIQAARNLGCPAIFIEGDPSHQKPGARKAASIADGLSDSLLAAVQRYLL